MSIEKLIEVKEICESLQAITGKKDKESILRQNYENQLLKDILQFVYNPYILTGLSDKKINKEVDARSRTYISDIYSAMDYLKNNNTGTDLDISAIQHFINSQPESLRSFLRQVFTKSLKLGCDVKTFNKVWGKKFIPTFDCMLAEKYFDKPERLNGKEFTVTLKIDGQRCLAIKKNDKVSFFSRQGQPIEGLVDIENEIMNIPGDNFVLDGELTLLNSTGLSSKEQYKQTLKITRKDGEKYGVKLLVFDFLELNEFENQICKNTYFKRRNKLTRLDNDILMKYVEVLPVLYSGNDISKIYELLDEVRANEEEGIMININDAMYEFKRTPSLLKVKVMQDADLKIIGFEEGSGRLSGTLGRINVEYKGSVVGVGSGFSDNDRKYFWKNQDELFGRVVTVQYFEESEDKDGVKSLRFPVFTQLCDFGKEVSYY